MTVTAERCGHRHPSDGASHQTWRGRRPFRRRSRPHGTPDRPARTWPGWGRLGALGDDDSVPPAAATSEALFARAGPAYRVVWTACGTVGDRVTSDG